MRTTIALAAFLVAGAGAMGASALDLKGSDTLEFVTKDLLQADATHAWDCGGVGQPFGAGVGTLVYVGSGSGNGESAIIGGTQQVAPMSRFLNPSVVATSGVCSLPNVPFGQADGGPPGGQSQTTAEAIAFARDGLSIVVNNTTAGTEGCNANSQACLPGTGAPDKGLAFDPTPGTLDGTDNILTVPGYVCPTDADTAPFRRADVNCVGGQYRILDSQDVLRLVYFGLDHDFINANQRNCGNVNAAGLLANPGRVRAALLENWGKLFRDPTNCSGTSPNTCTRLWRAFRRNDESGTTDAFVSLTGRKGFCLTSASPCSSTTVNTEISVGVPAISQPGLTSPFCNSRSASGAQCGPGAYGGFDNLNNPNNLPFRIALGNVNSRTPANSDPPPPLTGPGGQATNPAPGWDFDDTVAGNFGPPGTNPYFTDLQDFDCIRRECSGPFGNTAQEQICSARGDLGVVLPIWDPPAASAKVDPFPATNCAPGRFVFASAPPCFGVGASGKASVCPNGEKPQAAACNLPAASQTPGTCLTPSTSSNDPRCLNNAVNVPPTQRVVDGRVYNLHLHQLDTSVVPNHPYATSTRVNPAGGQLDAKMVATYYRIHQGRFLANVQAAPAAGHMVIRNSSGDYDINQSTPGGATAACNATTLAPDVSATRIIGCLAGSADTCSIGYAGGDAATLPGVEALRVNGVAPDTSCVQDSTYPLSRKLYLSTVKGFENVGGDELKLARCFADRTGASVGGGYPGIDNRAVLHGFITLDNTPANGTICQDFKEEQKCGATNFVNACTNNVAPIPTREQ